MQQETINQRLKFLIETLSTSVRSFSEQIGESTGNTNNYIGSRQLAPKHEYLAKVLKHFSNVNAHWLVTGEGEPFIGGAAPNPPVAITNKKNKGPVQNNTGDHNTINNNVNLDNCKRDLAAATKEVELLRQQLAVKDQLIEAKDEMLALLRGGYNRPN